MSDIRTFTAGVPTLLFCLFVGVAVGMLLGLWLSGLLKRAPEQFPLPSRDGSAAPRVHRQSHDERAGWLPSE